MRLSLLDNINTTRELTDVFGGLNHNPRPSNGEWFDMEGMTGDKYPLISTRKPYLQQTTVGNIHGMYAGEQLVSIRGTKVYYGTTQVTGDLPGLFDTAKQQIVVIGSSVCFFPAKMYFNYTAASPSLSYISGSINDAVASVWSSEDGLVSFSPTTLDMDPDEPILTNDVITPSESTVGQRYISNGFVLEVVEVTPGRYDIDVVEPRPNGTYWYDSKTKALKMWSSASEEWTDIPTSYIRVTDKTTGADNFRNIHDGDGIRFEHIPLPGQTEDTRLGDGYWYVNKAGNNTIIVTGQLDDFSPILSGMFRIYRDIPAMDYVVQMNNRLWGCSSEKHEIYACKLGDPRNWHCYAGLASDSYAVTIGSEGDFTGMAVYLGKVYAFKENHIHKIFGTMPSNFETTEKAVKGVAAGCSGSIVVMDDYLYYVSSDGVCRYDGSLPAVISQNLGNVKLTNACATALGKKLYLFADAEGEHRLYVYNAQHGFWHLEHRGAAKDIAVTFNGEVYAAKDGVEGCDILSGGTEEVNWYVESGKMMLSLTNVRQYSLNLKYVSSIAIRLKAALGARVNIIVKYNDGEYQSVRSITGDGRLKVIMARLIPHRSDYITLRIEGAGECEIYSLTKVIELGGEAK